MAQINWYPLRKFLKCAPSEVNEIHLSLEQIEIILGQDIPPDHSARIHYPYLRGMTWPGWKVAHAYTKNGTINNVVFDRE